MTENHTSPEVNRRVEYVNALIERSKMPRNQIAMISGLTNTYIRDLEKGKIANADREKLISLAVALNLDLPETDGLMYAFDRANLGLEDIPRFINTCSRRKISAALHPLKDIYIYELLVLTVEQTAGQINIVHDMPTSSLKAQGHRTYTDRYSVQRHSMYGELVEAMGRERQQNLDKILTESTLNHYICQKSLETYLSEPTDPTETLWRVRHVENLLSYVIRYPNFHLYLTKAASSFIFSLKKTDLPHVNDKIIFMSKSASVPVGERAGRLTGFVTDNPHIVTNFAEELASVQLEVIDQYRDTAHLIHYLETLIRDYRAQLNHQFTTEDSPS